MKRIAVFGSLNGDLVMRCERVPRAGETLHGLQDGFSQGCGGKGLNQAIACAQLADHRTHVSIAGAVGTDAYADAALNALARAGVSCEEVLHREHVSTGIAVIIVEQGGENRILLAAGANGTLTGAEADKIAASDQFRSADLLILQLEVPLGTVLRMVQCAGPCTRTLLNPAPAIVLPDSLYPLLHFLVPNETEAALLTGLPVTSPEEAGVAGKLLLDRGIKEAVIVTLGKEGSVIVDRQGVRHVPARQVQVVDTTAAGDSFIGGLAVKLVEGENVDEAVAFATRVAAITVTKHGASASIPSRDDLLS